MPKQINLGNGSLLIGLDNNAQVKDFYFHYPGLENHVSENLTHKIGIFIDNSFSWIDDGNWKFVVRTKDDTMASHVEAENEGLGIQLVFEDTVYNEKNIFLRKVTVKNKFDRRRNLKIFFNQQFNIGQTHTGETAYFDPREVAIVHYKGRRVFLIKALSETGSIDEYSVGLLGIEGHDGTYHDAEDGQLSGNPVEHGEVDSVIGLKLDISPNDESTVYYWICVAKSISMAKRLNEEVLARHPKEIITSSENYWRAWVKLKSFNFEKLPKSSDIIFNKSLFNIRTHVAKNGGIIASGDSEMLQFGRDYYEYVWPRDASFTAMALMQAGDLNSGRRFFQFCLDTITDEGFFMHKYRPDKSLGSSWHPWIKDGKSQFPIQEDETAIVLISLWEYYQLTSDLEFVEHLYNPLVKKAAEFMVRFRDDKTGLPNPSYDLWERVYGIHTFTASCVYGALNVAGKFAELLGKSESAKKYFETASEMKKAIMKYLYDQDENYFYKSVITTGKKIDIDKTYDLSSVFGIYRLGVQEANNVNLKKSFENMMNRLNVKTEVGGVARFEGDSYHHKGGDYPGNPWIITNLWYAQFLIDLAENESDLKKVNEILSWVIKNSSESGVLPEQLNAYTGEHLSASPLTWSHAEYVTTVIAYLNKFEKLGICKACK